MIVLEKVKIVLWDFDDTLCIRECHDINPDNEHKYNIDVLLHGKEVWDTCKPNIHMKKFMYLCLDKGVRQGLISATISCKHAISKCEWVKDNYGVELENFCVGTFEAKLDIMLAIADAFNYNRDEILLVDDFCKNIEKAANYGFQTCTPMEVVNFIIDGDYDA